MPNGETEKITFTHQGNSYSITVPKGLDNAGVYDWAMKNNPKFKALGLPRPGGAAAQPPAAPPQATSTEKPYGKTWDKTGDVTPKELFGQLAPFQKPHSRQEISKELPIAGGAVGGLVGGPGGAMVGGMLGRGVGMAISPEPSGATAKGVTKELLKSGGEQAAMEGAGKGMQWLGGAMMPSKVKRVMSSLLSGQLDKAGKDIDEYLSQPHIANTRHDYATGVNDFLNTRAVDAYQAGEKKLAKSLVSLRNHWAQNFNLTNATPLEAKEFTRKVGKLASFGKISDKSTVNQIKTQVVGKVSEMLRDNVFGLEELNAKYAGVVSAQEAITATTKKAMKSYPGAFSGLAGTALESLGKKFPTVARALEAMFNIDEKFTM